MKVRKIDRKIERHILIGMITNTNYLSFVSTKMTKMDLMNQYARTVAGWCLEYFEKYDEAPKSNIQKIYEYHDRKQEISEEETDMIQKLLQEISTEYSNTDAVMNTDFLLDKTEEYLKRNALQRLMVEVENKIDEGDVRAAEDEIINMRPVQITAAEGVDPLADLSRIQLAFEDNQTPIIEFDGAFGALMNEHMTRDSFVCFQAPEKTGKTWLLYYCAIQALKMKTGLKVVVFAAGDMTEAQSIVRFGIILCKKSNKKKYCGSFQKPSGFYELPGGREKENIQVPGNYDIRLEDVVIKNPLTAMEVHETYEKFKEEYDLKENFRMFTHPADTLTFTGIDAELDRLEKTEGFIADVVIVDYMDLIACEEKTDSERGSINKVWKKAKAMDNKRHILLISATQADANSYDGEVQGRKNYSEDKRKYSHVNIMVGMSQSDKEKKLGIMKFNTLVARDGDATADMICYVLQSLRTGEPVIDSIFHEREPTKEEQEAKFKRRNFHGGANRGRQPKTRPIIHKSEENNNEDGSQEDEKFTGEKRKIARIVR